MHAIYSKESGCHEASRKSLTVQGHMQIAGADITELNIFSTCPVH